MAAYSTAQMEESLSEEVVVPQAAPKPWKRFGLVAAVLGCVGGVVAMTRPQELTPMQQMQQMAHTGHAFMQAVALRALTDTTHGISVDLGMTFAPEGEEQKNAMSMKAYLQPAKEEGKKSPAVIVTFQAKEGSGVALKKQFNKALTAAKEHVGAGEGGEEAAAMFDLVDVSNDEDKVQLRITPPIPEVPDADIEMLEEGMQAKPTLELELSTGRDFQQMVDNLHGCQATLPGGFKISATTKLAAAIVSTVEDMGEQLGAHQHGREIREAKKMLEQAEAVAAISSFSSQSTVRYNTEKLEAAACPHLQSDEAKKGNQEMIEQMRSMLPHLLKAHIGEGAVQALAGLSEHSDSLHSIRVVGTLPDGYELHAEFKNFKLTPVITELLSPSAAAEA